MNNTVTFNGTVHTESSLADLSGSALVNLYNDVLDAMRVAGSETAKNIQDVRKFADKETAVRRAWKLLQQYAAHFEGEEQAPVGAVRPVESPKQFVAPKLSDFKKPVGDKPVTKHSPVQAPKKEKPAPVFRGTNLQPPGHAPIPCREGSKQAMLLDLLTKVEGVTMAELIEGLSGGKKPWTEATVRSGFGWDMKLKGYGVRSFKGEDGVERFRIVCPVGFSLPAHTPLKGKPKADARQARIPEVA